jgi:transposase
MQGLDRKTRDADLRVRCRIILKVDQGLSGRAAAREVGRAASTAARIVARSLTENEASLYDRRAENSGPRVDEDARHGLMEILQATPVEAFLRTIGQRIQLHFPPPYYPGQNRIERLRNDVHDSITRNHRCRTLHDLMDQVCLYLESRLKVRWGASCHV